MSDAHVSDVTVRAAEFSDAAVLASLMGQLGYPARTADMEMRLETILKDPRYLTLVAVADGHVCGMIGTFIHHTYEHNNPQGRILALVVNEEARGRGVGRKLITSAETLFAERNIRRLAVYTRLTREEAHEFYKQLGYTCNGYRFVKELGASAD